MESIQEQLEKIYLAAGAICERVFNTDVDEVHIEPGGDSVVIVARDCYGEYIVRTIAVEDLADPLVSADRIKKEIAEFNRLKKAELLQSKEYAQYRELRKKFRGL